MPRIWLRVLRFQSPTMMLRLWLMASPRRRHCRGICRPFEPGDDVFDAGPDAAVCAVVVVADNAAGLVLSRGGDRVMPRYRPSPRTTRPRSRCATVWRGHDDIVAVAWPHWPAARTRRRWAQMMIWVLTLRR